MDDIQTDCGNPNTNTAKSIVIPESLPTGNYDLTVNAAPSLPVTILKLDNL
jgi:hypothetical protein